MRLQLCDGIKERWFEQRAALIFLTALLFLFRPIMAAGFMTWAGITIFTEGLFVLLAAGFLLFRWETFLNLLKNTSWSVKICAGFLLASGVIHWLIGGYYRPEYLGLSLLWVAIPAFAAVYRNDLERKLPVLLGIFWLFNVIVCCLSESLTGQMFGMTGNWNWSASLLVAALLAGKVDAVVIDSEPAEIFVRRYGGRRSKYWPSSRWSDPNKRLWNWNWVRG